MAGEIPDFHATVRTGTGKGAARQARREGYVPGIVYGGDADPLPINVNFNMLLQPIQMPLQLSYSVALLHMCLLQSRLILTSLDQQPFHILGKGP